MKNLFNLILHNLTFLIPTLISIFALYRTYLKPAKIKIFTSERIAFWHDENGWLLIDVPIIFCNDETKSGIIHTMALILKDMQSDEDVFLLRWNNFLKYNTEKNSWDMEGFPFPIAVDKNSSVFKFVSFYAGECSKNWILKPGKYKLVIMAWSKPSLMPNLKETFMIDVDLAQSKRITDYCNNMNKSSIYIFRPDWGKWLSKKISKNELKNIEKI